MNTPILDGTAQRPSSNRLPILAAEIKAAHEKFSTVARTALSHAIIVGERLIEAKTLVDHGEWLPWLKMHCSISERQAQKYMRVARAKSAVRADLTIEAAIDALTVAKPVSYLPLAAHIKIGEHKANTFCVAPSYQHSGYFYVSLLTENGDGTGEVIGGRRPIHSDVVEVMIGEMDDNFAAYDWRDEPSAPWAFNILLFDTGEAYVDHLCLRDPKDRVELIALAKGSDPDPTDIGVHAKRPVVWVQP
jgi:DUF3102 family protein